MGLTLATAAAVTLPIVLYYASQGALADLWRMMFMAGFGQMPDWQGPLQRLLSPATFANAAEGRAAGFFLIAPTFVYCAVGIVLLVRLSREGLVARNVLTGALLAYGVATLTQAYSMPVVIRLLQSALPFYLLTSYLAFEVARRFLSRPVVAMRLGAAASWFSPAAGSFGS